MPAVHSKKRVAKNYSPEVRARATRLVIAEGKKMTHVAKDMGISYMTLVGWVTEARKAPSAARLSVSVSTTKAGGEARFGFTQSGRLFINKEGTEIVLEPEEVKFLKETMGG